MAAPVGAVVNIFYDAPELVVAPGDALKTGTGRTYLILDVRQQAKGAHVGRYHLRCLIGHGDETITGSVHPICWYPRRKG